MKVNQDGIIFIKKFEGLKLKLYDDGYKNITIGYGHLCSKEDIKKYSAGITEFQAEQILKKDLERFESGVSSLVKVAITQKEFNALVSFSFNLGLHTLQTSTLLKRLNKNDYKGASSVFLWYCNAGGKFSEGIYRRRKCEMVVFNGATLQDLDKENWYIRKYNTQLLKFQLQLEQFMSKLGEN